jgi:hypothetical protein
MARPDATNSVPPVRHFIVDDVLHAISRMMSTIVDAEIDAIMQTKLTELREIYRAASKGICGQRCEMNTTRHRYNLTCRRYWVDQGRVFSD